MDDVLGTAMTPAVHILALRNTQQKADSGLGLERIERKVIEDTTGGETGPPAAGSHGTKDR